MSILSGWFRAADSDSDNDAKAKAKAKDVAERDNLADALRWTSLIMNDDLDGAEAGLKRGDSSFHSLGSSVTFFIRSVLGFEKEVMTETTAKLADAEAKAAAEHRHALRRGRAGSVYPPGTEYELVRAETQLMSAVVGVLHESIVEAMRSFYKLRKAFIILDGIVAAESRPGLPRVSVSEPPTDTESSRPATPLQLHSEFEETEIQLDDPVDVFIHSGANLCLGLILVILSLVPPAFSRILSVVGFQGDRERGIKMLWRSAAHDNVNGALAGMMLLAFYNGLLGTVDILPTAAEYDEAAEGVAPPIAKCQALLDVLRARYPESRLWRVEEARFLGNERNLDRAVELLKTGEPAKMKQIAGLNNFELALDAMIMQDWPLMRDSFLQCLEVNDWSPAMYYYMAGCAHLEMYRDGGDDSRRHKTKAEEYFRKAPSVAGKKRLMARQLPIETFLQRKVLKWEERAKSLGVDLADAVGVSPAVEMSYMWNGQKRMSQHHFDMAVANLSWERCTAGDAVEKIKLEKDEMAAWAVSMASFLHGQGKLDEARTVLDEHVLCHDR